MKKIKNALHNIDTTLRSMNQNFTISFETFLEKLVADPYMIMRNVFQVFHDMVLAYVGSGIDEYPDDPESIHFVRYDCSKLLVDGTNVPFFADRLFANRFINRVKAFKSGAQQNKIYIFEGPHGSGKSTFLNNLLQKFEEYANSEEGMRYETVWRLNWKALMEGSRNRTLSIFEKLLELEEDPMAAKYERIKEKAIGNQNDDYVEVPCPSHDHPILMVPKEYRRPFFDDLFQNDEFKWKLFTDKEYEWVFNDVPCTICSSIYQSLVGKLGSPLKVFNMLFARPYRLNRRLGEGISVFNPGDEPMKKKYSTNEMLQNRINNILNDSNQVGYIYSRYAKTNNGIYAIMDIKSHNTERLIRLHNIISEGIHKVEYVEENVNSLFIALMNPEDKKNIQDIQSFSDRIEYVKIPYVLDLNTEVQIYRDIFGKHIDEGFLPRVLDNFARIIISSRLNKRSEALLEWIGDPEKYRLYCDENLQLLKMEIYSGYIPPWLTEEDLKRFTAKRRRRIIAESETEGAEGFSGRDSINIFNQFYTTYAKKERHINMMVLYNFFTKYRKDLGDKIPSGFMDSLIRMYDYTVLQEVKESLYYFNEEQISKDIQHYLFALNFEEGVTEICGYTGEKIEINEDFFRNIENNLIGNDIGLKERLDFRKETQKEYTSKTLTQEIMVEEQLITHTQLYQDLLQKYVRRVKEKVLDPFLKNENFRRAIKDWDEENFKTYDNKIRNDVTFLISNLRNKYNYTEQGAKEVCIYVIDNDLAGKYINT